MQSVVRISTCLIGGIATTSMLFFAMQWMITRELPEYKAGRESLALEFVRLKRESDTRLKERDLPEEPPDETPPPRIPELSLDVPSPSPLSPDISIPAPDFPLSFSGPVIGAVVRGSADRDVIAVSRVPPRYPFSAARKGIEGWVKVSLLVTETGTVKDVVLLDSHPPNVFDRSAVRAVYKWKFRPRIVDGKPVAARAEQIVKFALSK